jgi:hypothetical protein
MVEQKNYEIGFLFHVRYLDHVIFKNVDSELCTPVMRELVGWLVKENDEAMWIVCERSVEKVSSQKVQACESGMVILKSDLLEIKKIG